MTDPSLSIPITALVSAIIAGFGGWVVKSVLPSKSSPIEVHPQPLNVKAAVEFATRKDLDRVEERVSSLEEQLGFQVGELRKTIIDNYNTQMTSASKGRSDLHNEINDLRAAVARIEGKLELMLTQCTEERRMMKDIGRLEGVVQRGK